MNRRSFFKWLPASVAALVAAPSVVKAIEKPIEIRRIPDPIPVLPLALSPEDEERIIYESVRLIGVVSSDQRLSVSDYENARQSLNMLAKAANWPLEALATPVCQISLVYELAYHLGLVYRCPLSTVRGDAFLWDRPRLRNLRRINNHA